MAQTETEGFSKKQHDQQEHHESFTHEIHTKTILPQRPFTDDEMNVSF